MKVIFLDVDGVLNSTDSFKKSKTDIKDDDIRYDNPHPQHIQWLNKITDETGAKIVISSTWRNEFSIGAWNRFFSVLGVRGRVIGRTPKLDSYRGTEIQCWLLEHKSKIVKYKDSQWYGEKEPVTSFVILDDDSDMEDLTPYLVKTKSDIGLLEEHALMAINMLNEKHI